jgi:hypothetical protein
MKGGFAFRSNSGICPLHYKLEGFSHVSDQPFSGVVKKIDQSLPEGKKKSWPFLLLIAAKVFQQVLL